jgi:DNA-binding transcriptional LysR family regulator
MLGRMKLNQLDGLLAFWKVAQHRGFTAAAAELDVSPSALSQAIRQLEARLGARLLNRTTRSVSLTEAGEAYLARIGPAVEQVIAAGEDMSALQGRPSGTLKINAARVSVTMALQPMLASFLQEHPDLKVELTNDEGFVDIVEKAFDAGVRLGESVQQDMVAVPLTGPLKMGIFASPEYLSRVPAPRHPDDLLRHNCVRFRFAATGRIHRWEFRVNDRLIEYEVQGNLITSDTTFGLDAALEGIGLAYMFEELAMPHVRAKRLKKVLAQFSPTYPGFYLYYPNRQHLSTKLRALIDYVTHKRR